MSDLPARGDPEDLVPYCRYLLFNSAATTTEIVDHAGFKPHKERSARRIGRFIGAVHVTDDRPMRRALRSLCGLNPAWSTSSVVVAAELNKR